MFNKFINTYVNYHNESNYSKEYCENIRKYKKSKRLILGLFIIVFVLLTISVFTSLSNNILTWILVSIAITSVIIGVFISVEIEKRNKDICSKIEYNDYIKERVNYALKECGIDKDNSIGILIFVEGIYKESLEKQKIRNARVGSSNFKTIITAIVIPVISLLFQLIDIKQIDFVNIIVAGVAIIIMLMCLYMFYGLVVNFIESFKEDNLLFFEIKDMREYIVFNLRDLKTNF